MHWFNRYQWRDDWKQVLPWKRAFAHQAIDAGATAVLCHGSPRFAGIEIYRGRIICHSLGNFIFHVPHSRWWPMTDAWQSAMVKINFTGKATSSVQLWPIVLADAQGRCDGPLEQRLYPMLAQPDQARFILQRIMHESINLPASLQIEKDHATIGLEA